MLTEKIDDLHKIAKALLIYETLSGVITRVGIAPTGDAYGQEADGVTSANFGSYNGKFPSQAVSHKPSGEGQSVCAGSGAILASAVDWGDGFWWNTVYGQWFEFEGIPLLPMLSPGYLLRMPSAKKSAWKDLLTLKKRLELE